MIPHFSVNIDLPQPQNIVSLLTDVGRLWFGGMCMCYAGGDAGETTSLEERGKETDPRCV